MKGDFLDELCDLNGGVGFYTVNNKGELFYIDSKIISTDILWTEKVAPHLYR